MRILGVDTALGRCSAAVIAGDAVLAREAADMERGHAEAIAPMAQAALAAAGLQPSDLARIAVTIGPGTFTGQRVGLAFARGLAAGLSIPCVGVTTTAAMIRQCADEDAAADVFAAVLDARRSEVYLQIGPGQVALVSAGAAERRLAALAPQRVALCGTGAPAMAATLSGARALEIVAPDAAFVARLGAAIADPEAARPDPLYLRAPDAKLATLRTRI